MTRKGRKGRLKVGTRRLLIIMIVLSVLASGSVYLVMNAWGQGSTASQEKPIILYVNQGNGVVNRSDFGVMLGFASTNGFNTVFFQVYRQGVLLFSPLTLQSFVSQAHQTHLSIFFSLYITDQSQNLPSSIYGLGEDGVGLDMSAISLSSQQSFLNQLKASFAGRTAVTTLDMASTLRPDLLVLETYGTANQQYVRHGTIGSVGVFTTSSKQDYDDQFQYALQNSDGVMVFDYYGLLRAGY